MADARHHIPSIKKTPKYQLVIRYQMYDDALIELMQYLNKKLTIDVFVQKNG